MHLKSSEDRYGSSKIVARAEPRSERRMRTILRIELWPTKPPRWFTGWLVTHNSGTIWSSHPSQQSQWLGPRHGKCFSGRQSLETWTVIYQNWTFLIKKMGISLPAMWPSPCGGHRQRIPGLRWYCWKVRGRESYSQGSLREMGNLFLNVFCGLHVMKAAQMRLMPSTFSTKTRAMVLRRTHDWRRNTQRIECSSNWTRRYDLHLSGSRCRLSSSRSRKLYASRRKWISLISDFQNSEGLCI